MMMKEPLVTGKEKDWVEPESCHVVLCRLLGLLAVFEEKFWLSVEHRHSGLEI